MVGAAVSSETHSPVVECRGGLLRRSPGGVPAFYRVSAFRPFSLRSVNSTAIVP